ncbi:hypothetical protein TNCV_2663271 [Trichonephila clavipes]|nr:hypothetical protein TNCV_2663271 [Trichonephila clavipes]
MVKVSDHGGPCHEFEPSPTKDSPCRAAMNVKSVESSNILPLNLNNHSSKAVKFRSGYEDLISVLQFTPTNKNDGRKKYINELLELTLHRLGYDSQQPARTPLLLDLNKNRRL